MNKEQLEKQIAEMELKLQEMKEELNKPKEFEFKYPMGKTYFVDINCIAGECSNVSETILYHGRFRLKKENAELSLQRNKEANLIEALAEQLDPNWKADWEDVLQEKWYIYYDIEEDKYEIDGVCLIKDIGVPYMSEETAETICEMLNNGEFTL